MPSGARPLPRQRANAADRVLASVAPLDLGNGRRVGDALATPAVGEPVKQWLMERPITSVEFRDDLGVRLTLSASPAAFWEVLRANLSKQQAVPTPAGEPAWTSLRDETDRRMAIPAGTAFARAGTPSTHALALPARPPEWVDRAVEADGVAQATGPKLRTARAAENAALRRLRIRIEALPFSADMTVGDAAHRRDAHQ